LKKKLPPPRTPARSPTVSAGTFRLLVCAAALLNVFAVNLMFVSQMAFANRVADPAIGGTYITLINTVANLGARARA
jgi:hypothetical protein